jgi:DNA-binding NarL/FixJ family response regulator
LFAWVSREQVIAIVRKSGHPDASRGGDTKKADHQSVIRVAIIEDDPVMRERLASAISGCDDMLLIGTAANFAAGKGMIDAGGYDVLLCDLALPDGNGADLIRHEATLGRGTDILVVTIFANQNKVLDAIRAGARGYLLKDQRIDECIAGIREVRRGGSPISPIIARQLLGQIRPDPQKPDLPPVSPLSERELEVLNLISRGYSNHECAGILSVSVNTIGTHVKNIYRKLEVNSRAEALFEAMSQGILAQR